MVTLPQRNYSDVSNCSYNSTVRQGFKHTQDHNEKYVLKQKLSFCFDILQCHKQINDYVAGYHDGALLFGKVLRERMLSQRHYRETYVPLNNNPFGNVSFDGKCDQQKLNK